jgi:hypothetical protein
MSTTEQSSVTEQHALAPAAKPETPVEPVEKPVPTRRGDINKCPVCGSSSDPEVFYCAKCRNYFCFHCRARSLASDSQLQCVNQGCDYYGKLVCGICDPGNEKDETPSVYMEPEDGYWPAWLAIVLVLAAFVWYFSSWFLAAFATFLVVYAAGGYFIQRAGWNLFGSVRRVEHQNKSSFHTCIRCQQPVKEVRQKS